MKGATIVWTPRALHQFYRLSTAHAEQIDHTVQRLAGGDGILESIPDEPGRFRLRADPLVAVVSYDRPSRTLYVWRVRRER